MTKREQKEIENLNDLLLEAEKRAYIGPLVNLEGESYGSIYDASKLTEFEMTLIRNGVEGERMNGNIWNQVWFEFNP